MSMKTIFESVIREGTYNLADIISKAHEEYVANNRYTYSPSFPWRRLTRNRKTGTAK